MTSACMINDSTFVTDIFRPFVRSSRSCCCEISSRSVSLFFFFQAEDGIRDLTVTGVQTCALPIWWASQNGPFFNERVMIYPYFFPRRETIMDEVRLFERVFLPFVCWPHGETG